MVFADIFRRRTVWCKYDNTCAPAKASLCQSAS